MDVTSARRGTLRFVTRASLVCRNGAWRAPQREIGRRGPRQRLQAPTTRGCRATARRARSVTRRSSLRRARTEAAGRREGVVPMPRGRPRPEVEKLPQVSVDAAADAGRDHERVHLAVGLRARRRREPQNAIGAGITGIAWNAQALPEHDANRCLSNAGERSSLAGFARSPECVDKSVTENGHVRGGSHS